MMHAVKFFLEGGEIVYRFYMGGCLEKRGGERGKKYDLPSSSHLASTILHLARTYLLVPFHKSNLPCGIVGLHFYPPPSMLCFGKTRGNYLSSRHSSMVSTVVCYRGGPGFKSRRGREFINFRLKRKFINLKLNTIISFCVHFFVNIS